MKSFEILAQQFRPMLATYLKTLVGSEDLAEDLTQETFLTAQRSLARFAEGSNFGAWLRGIARNKVRETRRAAARMHVVTDSRIIEGMEEVYGVLDGPHSEYETWTDRVALLSGCIARLSETLKSAVEVVYRERRTLAACMIARAGRTAWTC